MGNPSTSVESTAGGAVALKPLSHSNDADRVHDRNSDLNLNHEHSTSGSSTDHVPEISNSKFLVIILAVGGISFLSSFVTGLLTVGLPRTAEDIGLSDDLVFW